MPLGVEFDRAGLGYHNCPTSDALGAVAKLGFRVYGSCVDATTEIRRLASDYAQKYGHAQNALEKGLEAFAVHLFAQEDGFDSVLQGEDTEKVDLGDYILRSNDLGVDGVLVDETSKRVLLVQATWRRNTNGVEEKIVAFGGIVDRLVHPDYLSHGGEAAIELLGSLRDQIKDDYSIELRFVTNLRVGNKERLQAAVEAANRAYDDSGRRITYELLGASDLIRRKAELLSANTGAAVKEATFAIQNGKAIVLDTSSSAPRKTLVAVLKGNELASLYKKEGTKLFAANIRLPLITKKVNPEIKRTAQQAPDDFFYFNNGVSAVCKNFDLDGNIVSASNFQIINGAQTVDSIGKALGNSPSSELYVLFRLTETEEGYGGSFSENVIRYNNTQNPVKVSDFFSNEPIQVWLADKLSECSGKGPVPAFYYVHKSGYRPGKYRGRKQLKIDAFAGIRHAFLYGPVVSYREPATFFDRNGRYSEAFGVDANIVPSWNTEVLAQAACAITINNRVQSIAQGLKKDEATRKLAEARYLFRLSRYCTALAGVGLRAIMPARVHDYSTLMASEVTFNRYAEPLLNKARDLIEAEMASLSLASVQPEYNFARDEKTWLKLETLMNSAALTRINFNG